MSNSGQNIPFVSGAKPAEQGGHFDEFSQHPAQFLTRAYEECGELAEFDIGGTNTVLMVGPEAHEAVFRADDIKVSAREAYQFMVPIFGKGVQYGAPLDIERQQLRMHSRGLASEKMNFYAPIITKETQDWIADWGDEGEFDFYEGFADLTIKTSTHCLLGPEFRYSLTDEFASLYHTLGAAADAGGLQDPNARKDAYDARDAARARLEELITERIDIRRESGETHMDLLQVYMDATYNDGTHLSTSEVAGMIVWFMFAGHHTSANTAAWTLVELARHPELAAEVVAEVDAVIASGEQFDMKVLRRMSKLDGFIRETLRVHPPLNTLTRRVIEDFEYKGHIIEKGKNVMLCPYVAHRLESSFEDALAFKPDRPLPDNPFALIPFGGGQRKCVGNAFAMLQVKVIFSVLLNEYEFELAGPSGEYAEIMPSLILRPSDPCILRYRRRVDRKGAL
ncbi:cytochrome P450 [Parahaliea sp. F7430]|uniref:Cytochrome P450 n=1 Tax=Sediminihaliea albiluteola TaxID=2758564 RepID=A0A7W2YKG6_9GAMM|nr:cytochrome P450 [Sediminihaliea albiluteola]MBA6413689.1 cytochrome P450 [Sediminihaliea albiluteola]